MFKFIKKIASNNVDEAKPIEPTESEVKSQLPLPLIESSVEFMDFIPLGIEAELPPFPINVIHPLLQDYILSAAEMIQTSIDLVATCVLAALSIACRGKYPTLHPSGHEERPCFYFLPFAPPSGKKSGVQKLCIKPLSDYEREYNQLHAGETKQSESDYRLLESRIAKAEKTVLTASNAESRRTAELELQELNKELADFVHIVPLRLFGSDVTPEKLASLMKSQDEVFALASAEGGGIFENIGKYCEKGGVDLYLIGYSGDCFNYDRKSSDTIVLENPTLNIIAPSQPSVVKDLFLDTQKDGRGLLTRILFVKCPSYAKRRNALPKPIDKSIEEAYLKLCYRMLESETSGNLEYDKTGVDEYALFFYEIDPYLEDEQCETKFDEWVGKLQGQMTRLAGLIHCIDSFIEGKDPLDSKINADQTRAAVELARYFFAHANAVYTEQSESKQKSDARYLWKRIKSIKSITKQELLRKTQGKTGFDLDESLSLLNTRGYIKIVRGNSGKAGRPSETIFVNPEAQKQ